MTWLVIILLLILLAGGAVWAVVKVAVGVAVGLFLAFVLIAAYVGWRLRRAFRHAMEGQPRRTSGWRRLGSSTVEVRDPPDA